MKNFLHLTVLAALAGNAVAQLTTECDPTKKTTCPADPALATQHLWYFNETLDSRIWTMETGELEYTPEGGDFTIHGAGQSTLLTSNFYIFFGVVEAWVKMATGQGIVSSVVLESDDLDEIDWEWVGYNTNEVQSNFYGKGNTTTYNRGRHHQVDNAADEFHNYTTYWDQDKLQWWIDGVMQRQVNYGDALAVYGKNYPQTPSQVKFSNWPAGQPGNSQGTIDWAGGLVDYSQAPFTMTVQSVRVQDFHTGKEYIYGDMSGSWQSIIVKDGHSAALTAINHPPQSLSEKWEDLGEGAHIGVYIGAAAAGTLILLAFVFFCIRQRRKGRLEHALGEARQNDERTEMENYQNDWKQSEWRQTEWKHYRQVNG